MYSIETNYAAMFRSIVAFWQTSVKDFCSDGQLSSRGLRLEADAAMTTEHTWEASS